VRYTEDGRVWTTASSEYRDVAEERLRADRGRVPGRTETLVSAPITYGPWLAEGEEMPEPPPGSVVIDDRCDAWQRSYDEPVEWCCALGGHEEWRDLNEISGPLRLVYVPEGAAS
jgi:hypothetical protein